MSDKFVEIKLDNKEIEQALLQLAQKCEDLTPMMRNIAGILADAVEENFEKEGRPDKWQELAESTIKKRTKKGHFPGRILQVEGNLANSITTQYDSNSAIIGSNLKYSRIHQLGEYTGRGKKIKIPVRPYLNITENEKKQILNEVIKYLNTQIV